MLDTIPTSVHADERLLDKVLGGRLRTRQRDGQSDHCAVLLLVEVHEGRGEGPFVNLELERDRTGRFVDRLPLGRHDASSNPGREEMGLFTVTSDADPGRGGDHVDVGAADRMAR